MKFNKKIIPLLLLSVLVLPQSIWAAEMSKKEFNKNSIKFCENLDQKLLTSKSKLDNKEIDLKNKLQARQSELADKRANHDTEIEKKRTDALQAEEQKINQLLSKASSTEVKQAISDFQVGVKSAIEKRNQETMVVRNDYRTNLDKLINDRQAKITQALADRKTAIEQAINKAKNDCQSGLDEKVVKSNFQALIKSAQDSFKLNFGKLGHNSSEIQTLVENRKKQIDVIQAEYKTMIESLKLKLKTALGK